jgi:hypothetical protein
MAETKNYSTGYDAIFGKKKATSKAGTPPAKAKSSVTAKKTTKPAAKKATPKKPTKKK